MKKKDRKKKEQESAEAISRLKTEIHNTKLIRIFQDPEVPIVIVANKSDLTGDPDLPHESLEATALFDWENGYVESSAKDRININKIFKELLNQAKSRFDISIPMTSSTSTSENKSGTIFSNSRQIYSVHNQQPPKIPKSTDECLKRRQSLPAMPAGN